MSKTFRRKNSWNERWNGKKWAVSVWETNEFGIYGKWLLDNESHEFKKCSAIFHSDSGTHSFKEPGPSWFNNMFSQRPYRRKSRLDLHKFVQGDDSDVIIEDIPKLEYWT